MAKYRKKPVVIEAMQLRWDNWNALCDFIGVGKLEDGKPEGKMAEGNGLQLNIPTLEGLMLATENDWIIKGIKGEIYPCKPDIFEATYEAVEQQPTTDLKTSAVPKARSAGGSYSMGEMTEWKGKKQTTSER